MKYFAAIVCFIGVCFLHLGSLAPGLVYTPIIGACFVGSSLGYLTIASFKNKP